MTNHTLREQLRTLATDYGYQRVSVPVGGADVFQRGERMVEIEYIASGNKVYKLHVNGARQRPAGKWQAIEALKVAS